MTTADEVATRVGSVFTPSAPVDQRSLFAGRLEQLNALMDAVVAKGQHAVVYGERGVGKTSIVSVLGALLKDRVTVRENCLRSDSFGTLWARALASVKVLVERPGLGFEAPLKQIYVSLADQVGADPAPDQVVRMLRRADAPIVFVFDEFDQVAGEVSTAFAEAIKSLSDYAVPATIVLVGVGDSVDALVAAHASIERALVQIRMPRMKPEELTEIITKASAALAIDFEEPARARVVRLAQGLPHYVHLLGLHSVRHALNSLKSTTVALASVEAGTRKAVQNASQSLLDSYHKATSTPRRDSLFKEVLLACALTRPDDLGYFSPGEIRPALRALGKPMEIPAFASHLNKFTTAARAEIFQRTGQQRRFRYRFKNPLMQPFVVLRGVADELIGIDSVDRLLSEV